ncbi:MAG TPA: glycoside hydrolase family 31 protein [Ferruginibacter sp.]|nr:glycoside hydrolase family 31 protein [Ferruginibacter sp.]
MGTNSFAQNPVKDIGNITSVKINGQQVNITTQHANVLLTVYSPGIIRVRIDKEKFKPDQSYAVIMQPKITVSKITEDKNQVSIVTDSLKVNILKYPFNISFYSTAGTLINKDEEGLNTSWVGEEVTTYKTMQDGERFIGLGEKTGNLDRRGNGYTNWNTDAFGYSTGQDPIYSSIPFYIGIHHHVNYGIFLDNSYQSDFNFGASNNRFSSFGARGGEMNYYFIYNTTIAGIIQSYTSLTGRMKMPPLWSLGYQQNRYSYYPDTEVLRIAQTLREKRIPADGITLDIHYMDKYQLFTWDKERFPNPVKLTSQLKEMGFETTVIVDPGIKIQPGTQAFERGLQADAFLKYADGKYYTGQVWPGWCYFPDFTAEKGRNFWKKEMKFFKDNGVKGIWNDMNEIATWGQKMPSNIIFDFEGRKASHLEGRNVYALEMARSSFEGARMFSNERPFILTRAGYAGLQRYTAIWTGDNRSEDDHMLLGVRLMNSLGLSGVPFTGMDIGGFTGNPSTGLYTRWIQLGAFLPYFRNHTAINTKSSEPWTYGEEVTDIARNYISLRYKLMPYLYSTFYEASQTGMPVVRSLAIENTFNPKVFEPDFQNQFLLGKSLLIIPVESNKRFTKIYFPEGKWYNMYNDDVQLGAKEKIIELSNNKLPVYIKESSIIPMQSLVQSTAFMPTDTLMLHIYNGNTPNTYVYYEDDGKTYEYEKGDFYRRNIVYQTSQNKLILEKVEGSYKSKFKNIMLVLHGFKNLNNISVNGKQLLLQPATHAFLSQISSFDPQGQQQSADTCNTLNVVIKNDDAVINIFLKQ